MLSVNWLVLSFKTFFYLGTLPLSAVGTSEICKLFNDLFDVFNSCNQKEANPARRPFQETEYQKKVIQDAKEILESVINLR